MIAEGIPEVMHYLDDFLFFSPPGSISVPSVLSKAIAVYDTLGVPVAANKLEGLAASLTFLGVG